MARIFIVLSFVVSESWYRNRCSQCIFLCQSVRAWLVFSSVCLLIIFDLLIVRSGCLRGFATSNVQYGHLMYSILNYIIELG